MNLFGVFLRPHRHDLGFANLSPRNTRQKYSRPPPENLVEDSRPQQKHLAVL